MSRFLPHSSLYKTVEITRVYQYFTSNVLWLHFHFRSLINITIWWKHNKNLVWSLCREMKRLRVRGAERRPPSGGIFCPTLLRVLGSDTMSKTFSYRFWQHGFLITEIEVHFISVSYACCSSYLMEIMIRSEVLIE